jgi:phosphomannomutase
MAMAPLPIMSVSGIRGKVGESLTEQLVSTIAFFQTKRCGGGTMVVGRDTRPSGGDMAAAAFRGIRLAGGTPIDIGIAPTPTTCFAVKHFRANGGIIITASHNPLPYNGYKMVHASGRLFSGEECEAVYRMFREQTHPSAAELAGCSEQPGQSLDAVEPHLAAILANVDVAKIRAARISVAVDAINGAAGVIFPKLLERLGVGWQGVYTELSGDFLHNPEPRPEHLTDLAALLRSGREFWGGFAFDPDADRLATMGEGGQPISEEMTLALALQNVLSRQKSDIATNLSTSMVIDDVARACGARVIRTKIGEANVVEALVKNHCVIGGEGNGGVIYPAIATVRDGLTALALIVELMATTGKKLTALAGAWPVYHIVKEKIPLGDRNPQEAINQLAAAFKDEEIDLQDGLKIIRSYGWVHLRPSNTEPIMRCYAEARSAEQAAELARLIMSRL